MKSTRKQQSDDAEAKDTNLRQLRRALDMTQQEMATAIGVALSSLRDCEKGNSELRMTNGQAKKLDALVKDRLGLSIHDLPDSLSAKSTNLLSAVGGNAR